MPVISIIRPVENPRGTGKVFKQDHLIANVRYNLDVLEEEPLTFLPAGQRKSDNFESVIGNLLVIDKGRRLAKNGVFTLQLEDSRRLDFYCQTERTAHPVYAVRSSGVFY